MFNDILEFDPEILLVLVRSFECLGHVKCAADPEMRAVERRERGRAI